MTERRATTLVGRDNDLAALACWRDSDSSVAIRCITGRAGSGKTRLAIEACEAAEEQGWDAGFASGKELARFHGVQNLAQWRWTKDALVVVDDAAISAGIIKDWFTALARRPRQAKEARLRILLLERHADADSDYGWWAELKRSDSLAQAGAFDLIGAEPPVPLPSIPGAESRRAVLGEAMRLAAGFLGKPVIAPPPAGANAEFDRRLSDDALENEPLFLLMAGIVATEHGAPAALSLGRIELARILAAEERDRLARFGASRELSGDGNLIAHLAACVTLQRGCDFAAARELVDQEIAAMGFAPSCSAETLVDLLADALPGPAGAEIDRVRPDLIGEAFLINEVIGLRGRGEDSRLAIIERARRRNEANVLETLVLAAQDLAAGAAGHPAVRWLTALANRSTCLEELVRISDVIPSSTLALCELGAVVVGRIAELVRQKGGDENAPLLAAVLHNLAFRQSALGQREEALVTAQEAVDLCRSLAAAQPDSFNAELAWSLVDLTAILAHLRHHEAALAAAQEAETLYRTLAAADPDAFRPGLARACNNLATSLSSLDQEEMALAAGREAIELYRSLAAAQPDAFNPGLASSLNNLAAFLAASDEHEAALEAARESVALERLLAAGRPDAFEPSLANSLLTLSTRLADLDQHEAAVAAGQEAIGLFRRLAATRPDAFNPRLAATLNNISVYLTVLDRCEAALAAAQEAVDLRSALAAAQPDAFNPGLAGSLNNLATCLNRLGRDQAALAAAEKAVELHRILATDRPDTFTAGLAQTLSNLAMCLDALDRREEASTAEQEAVELRGRMAAARAVAICGERVVALSMLADLLEARGQLTQAVVLSREAIFTLEPRFLASPTTFADGMRVCVSEYVRRMEAAGMELDSENFAQIIAKFEEEEGKDDAD